MEACRELGGMRKWCPLDILCSCLSSTTVTKSLQSWWAGSVVLVCFLETDVYFKYGTSAAVVIDIPLRCLNPVPACLD